ncbi:MAG: carboxypeptidase-like regulatory domain-containing protein [Leadbetterella sp.]|nr:carboxypeptidase-like regulatory domain-containing protein [Leadbetterella sp.]
MQKLLLSFSFLLISLLSFSQNSGTISGKVIDKEGNLSLPGATLALDGNKRYTISNQTGDFEFLNVPAGKYTVSVSYIGYQPLSREVTVAAGQNTVVDFVLDADAGSLQEIVIIGDLLRGQARAINQQKSNQNITNVISSDQVGRFPDANIGDALKRVPGITMQNDQGEARNIIVRGLAPSLNSVTLNGDRIPSAEGDNRNVQMDLIPSDMISTIEVNKTLTPDMDADAIGGSVNLVTRAAPNGERISATIAGGYGPIRDKANFTAGLVYGNRFLNKKLGAVLSGSFFNNNFGSDNVEAVWTEGKKNQVYVEELDIRKYDVQRVRRSAALAVDYKFNDRNVIYANAMYNWRDDRENRFRARYRGIKPVYDDADNITGYTGAIRRQTKGGIDNNRNKNRRLEEQKVQNYSLKGEHLIGSKLDFDWQMNYSKAQEFRPSERYIEFEAKDLAFTEHLGNPEKPLINNTFGSGFRL